MAVGRFRCPIWMILAPLAPPAQRESSAHADATQPVVAPDDLMAAVLALLQEQKAAMSEQKVVMSEQKVAMSEQKAAVEQLEASQGWGLI